MKTLLFTLEYPPFKGGVANYYGNLVKFWPDRENILVLNNNEGALINPRLPFLKWLPAAFELKKAVKNKNINHILVGHILPLGPAALIISLLYGVKYSVILHGMDFSYALKNPRKKFLSRLVLAGSWKIICSNSYTAGLVKKFLPDEARKKITAINPGVAENNELSENKYDSGGKLILLSVGRLVKRKGFDKVIEALPEVLKKIPNLLYVILGDGEEMENLKQKIKNLNLKKQVSITSRANDEEKNAWYNTCDIFIMPSREIKGDFEGFGIVYLEANLAGKPVIAGRSGGVADAVINGVNGLLVDPEDAGEISAAIIKLALDSGLRRKLGEQGRERAIKEFDWKKQTEKIYNFLINA